MITNAHRTIAQHNADRYTEMARGQRPVELCFDYDGKASRERMRLEFDALVAAGWTITDMADEWVVGLNGFRVRFTPAGKTMVKSRFEADARSGQAATAAQQ